MNNKVKTQVREGGQKKASPDEANAYHAKVKQDRADEKLLKDKTEKEKKDHEEKVKKAHAETDNNQPAESAEKKDEKNDSKKGGK